MACIGTIVYVDEKNFTCIVDSVDGLIRNVALPGNYDPNGGGHSITLPSIGSPVMYEIVNDTAYVTNTYFPINYDETPEDGTSEGYECRRPSDMDVEGLLPGGSASVGANGSQEVSSSNMKKIIMNPDKLYSIWNLTNCLWHNVCNVFKLSASGIEIDADSGQGGSCNTTISFRKSAGGGPIAVLSVGSDSGGLELSVGGDQILHIDEDRNLTLNGNNVTADYNEVSINATGAVDIYAEKLDFNCPDLKINADNIEISANVVDLSTCGSVKLP